MTNKTFDLQTIFATNKARMILDPHTALLLAENFGGWIAFIDESDDLVEWFSIQWTMPDIFKAKTGDFTVDPWGKYETRMNDYWAANP